VRIANKEVRGLIGPVEAVQAGLWFRAERYRTYRGEIHPDGWRVGTTMPLADSDLFLSFARLGAHGAPTEVSVMSWIGKHGLLKLRDPERWKRLEDGTPNQAPMKIEDFRAEVRKAYVALTLFEQIRSRDIDALRGRVGRERVYLTNPPANWPSRDGSTSLAMVTIDSVPTTVETSADEELSDEYVLSLAVHVLEDIVEQKIRHYGVTLVFSENDDHPRPLSPSGGWGWTSYRPELTLNCLNLEVRFGISSGLSSRTNALCLTARNVACHLSVAGTQRPVPAPVAKLDPGANRRSVKAKTDSRCSNGAATRGGRWQTGTVMRSTKSACLSGFPNHSER
jgi:hypothetical protein